MLRNLLENIRGRHLLLFDPLGFFPTRCEFYWTQAGEGCVSGAKKQYGGMCAWLGFGVVGQRRSTSAVQNADSHPSGFETKAV